MMNKKNNYTQMILDRLNRRDPETKKSNLNSNQKTQATPSDLDKHSKKQQVKKFFSMFTTNCAVFHQPVIISKKAPMKRCLFWDFNQIKHSQPQQPRKDRVATQQVQTSQFTFADFKKTQGRREGLSHYSRQLRELKQSVNLKRSESQVITNCKAIESYVSIPRNKSLKTVPTSSTVVTSSRRTLIYPSYKPVARDNKPQRRNYLKKCESYQKYVMNF